MQNVGICGHVEFVLVTVLHDRNWKANAEGVILGMRSNGVVCVLSYEVEDDSHDVAGIGDDE